MNKAIVVGGVLLAVVGIAYVCISSQQAEGKPLGTKGKKQAGSFDITKGDKVNIGGQKSGVSVTAPSFDPFSFLSGIFGNTNANDTTTSGTTATTD